LPFFYRYEIKQLMLDGTSIFIDDLEYRFVIRTQFFISDLPARSLFLRTTSFNGYYACHYCLTKGLSHLILTNRIIFYFQVYGVALWFYIHILTMI